MVRCQPINNRANETLWQLVHFTSTKNTLELLAPRCSSLDIKPFDVLGGVDSSEIAVKRSLQRLRQHPRYCSVDSSHLHIQNASIRWLDYLSKKKKKTKRRHIELWIILHLVQATSKYICINTVKCDQVPNSKFCFSRQLSKTWRYVTCKLHVRARVYTC